MGLSANSSPMTMLTQSYRPHHIIHIVSPWLLSTSAQLSAPYNGRLVVLTPVRYHPTTLGIMDGRQVEKGGHYRGLIRGGEGADAKAKESRSQ